MTTFGHTAEIAESLAAYALGALEGDDLRQVREHLAAGCPECEAQLVQLERDMEALLDSMAAITPVNPAETTRARLLRSLPPTLETPVRRDTVGWGWLAAAAVLLLAVGGGWLTARNETAALRAERDNLTQKVSGLGRELAAARAQSERLAQAMAIISAPGMRPVTLAALKAPPGAAGYAFVDPAAQKAVFVAANLPALAPDQTYELWFIAEGKPVAAGTFGVDSQGRSGTVQVQGVAPIDRIQAWAVTIEPRGGVPQPTGPMVLKG